MVSVELLAKHKKQYVCLSGAVARCERCVIGAAGGVKQQYQWE